MTNEQKQNLVNFLEEMKQDIQSKISSEVDYHENNHLPPVGFKGNSLDLYSYYREKYCYDLDEKLRKADEFINQLEEEIEESESNA